MEEPDWYICSYDSVALTYVNYAGGFSSQAVALSAAHKRLEDIERAKPFRGTRFWVYIMQRDDKKTRVYLKPGMGKH